MKSRDKEMNFGFDIDDTLINLREHAFQIYKQKLKQDLSLDVFHALNRVEIHEPFGLTNEEGKEMWDSSLEQIYYTNCPAYPGALEVLNELEKQGHSIYYITARPKEHGIRSREWLKEQGFPVEDTQFFYGMKDHEKVDIIADLNLDYYVDDKATILESLVDLDMTLILKDQSYNQDKDFLRLTDWQEFHSLVSKNEKILSK
ncbi:5' nucleotidase, NT5C type [Oceanobacillus sp. CAU 1775]